VRFVNGKVFEREYVFNQNIPFKCFIVDSSHVRQGLVHQSLKKKNMCLRLKKSYLPIIFLGFRLGLFSHPSAIFNVRSDNFALSKGNDPMNPGELESALEVVEEVVAVHEVVAPRHEGGCQLLGAVARLVVDGLETLAAVRTQHVLGHGDIFRREWERAVELMQRLWIFQIYFEDVTLF